MNRFSAWHTNYQLQIFQALLLLFLMHKQNFPISSNKSWHLQQLADLGLVANDADASWVDESDDSIRVVSRQELSWDGHAIHVHAHWRAGYLQPKNSTDKWQGKHLTSWHLPWLINVSGKQTHQKSPRRRNSTKDVSTAGFMLLCGLTLKLVILVPTFVNQEWKTCRGQFSPSILGWEGQSRTGQLTIHRHIQQDQLRLNTQLPSEKNLIWNT